MSVGRHFSILESPRGIEIVGVGAIFLFFSFSLTGGFVADDWAMIVDNSDKMTGAAALVRFFTEGVWKSSNYSLGDDSLYRPLWLTWHFLVYQVAEENALIWHLSNIALHSLNLVLLLRLAEETFPQSKPLERLACGLIFALHPAVVQNVAWITASTDLLMGAFSLSAILCFIRGRHLDSTGYLVASALLYAGALFSKEPAILLPLVMLAWDVFHRSERHNGFRQQYLFYFIAGAFAFLYLAIRNQIVVQGAIPAESFAFDGASLVRLAEYALRYAGLAVIPWPVPYYMEHPRTGFFQDPSTMHQLISGAGFLAILTVALFRAKAARFAVILCCVAIAAPLALALHDKGLFGPRFLYLPLAGFGLVLLAGLLRFRPRLEKLGPSTAFIPVLIVAGLGLVELPDWKNQMTWGEKLIATDPSSRYGWSAKGQFLADAGENEALKIHYRKAIAAVADEKFKGDFAENLAILHANDNEMQQSLEAYSILPELKGFEAKGYIGMGNVLWSTRRLDEARRAYERAVEFDPENFMALYNLGKLSESRGDVESALRYYERALEVPVPREYMQAALGVRSFVARYGANRK